MGMIFVFKLIILHNIVEISIFPIQGSFEFFWIMIIATLLYISFIWKHSEIWKNVNSNVLMHVILVMETYWIPINDPKECGRTLQSKT
jgi:hypothetical protein